MVCLTVGLAKRHFARLADVYGERKEMRVIETKVDAMIRQTLNG
jgi:hypothetical protein